MARLLITAAASGLAACIECGLVSPRPHGAFARCPRCGAALRSRGPDAIARSLALVAAAAVCYVPANVLPVLVSSVPGGAEADTIMGGVLALQRSGSWVLALVVLVASVAIPIGKMAVIAYLCAAVRFGFAGDLRDCTRLFRVVEFIGRWSMLDVFVDAFVVALVQVPPFMSVRPGPGVAFFAGTAVLTMLAAMAFDPRLLWDAHERAARDG